MFQSDFYLCVMTQVLRFQGKIQILESVYVCFQRRRHVNVQYRTLKEKSI